MTKLNILTFISPLLLNTISAYKRGEYNQPFYVDEVDSSENVLVLKELKNTIESKAEDELSTENPGYLIRHRQMITMANELEKSIEANDSKFKPSQALFDWMAQKSSRSTCRSAMGKAESCDNVLPINLNYGCWCHADSPDIFKGTGQFVDEFDKACKMYKQCLRCVRHDARSEGEVCDPGTQVYFTENQKSKEGILAECSSANQADCATHTCCCDLEYIRTILKLFIRDGKELQGRYQHANDRFNYEESCIGVGPGPHTRECCGDYPTRRMYSTFSKDCCHNHSIFDPMVHICCDDGESAVSQQECENPNKVRKRRRIERIQRSRSMLGFYNM